MAKADNDNAESPADKAKREAAERAEQEKLDAEKQKMAEEAKRQEAAAGGSGDKPEDPEVAKARQEKFAKAIAFEEARAANTAARPQPFPDSSTPISEPAQIERKFNEGPAKAAAAKLDKMALALPSTTPGEHVLFGLGGTRFTAQDLRELTGIRR